MTKLQPCHLLNTSPCVLLMPCKMTTHKSLIDVFSCLIELAQPRTMHIYTYISWPSGFICMYISCVVFFLLTTMHAYHFLLNLMCRPRYYSYIYICLPSHFYLIHACIHFPIIIILDFKYFMHYNYGYLMGLGINTLCSKHHSM